MAERSSIEKSAENVRNKGLLVMAVGAVTLMIFPPAGTLILAGGSLVAIPAEATRRFAKRK